MKILIVTPEVAPFAKVGGLADVAGSLPKALSNLGHDVRVVCPLYGSIQRNETWVPMSKPLSVQMGTNIRYARVWERPFEDSEASAFFIEYDEFFARPEIYEGPWGWHADNDKRFGFFSRAALELCFWMDWMPDVVHVHDWPTGLVPVMLNTVYSGTELGKAASVLTIHNIQHQGYCDRSIIGFLGLPEWLFRADQIEAMGAVSMLKGGIFHSTKLTTVSPTYAEEVKGPVGGQGLNSILNFRGADLSGILNGIDTSVWNPETDKIIPARFNVGYLDGKKTCKKELCAQFGLNYDPAVPVFGVVSRLYEQKGLDLLGEIADGLVGDGRMQIVILGSGDAGLEHAFNECHNRHPGSFAIWTGFDEERAHLIYAGADFLLMPSRFEPCGLGQMYAMNYGTIPVARATGGLVDTVRPYDGTNANRATGFLFKDPDSRQCHNAIASALRTWREKPEHIAAIQRNGMHEDFTWNKRAESYVDVYKWAADTRRGLSLD